MLRLRIHPGSMVGAALLLLGPVTLLAYPRNWDHTIVDKARFDVDDQGALDIDVPDADVVIEPGPDREVSVEIEVASPNLDRALERYEDMDFRIDGRTDRVQVTARASRGGWRAWRGSPHVVIVRVTMPESFHVDVETSDGNISVRSMRGRLSLKTSDGDIHVGKVDSPRVLLDTSDGDIILGEVTSPDVQIETSDGTIEVENIAGNDVDIRTSDGDIVIDAMSGGLNAQTTDGDIRVHIDDLAPTTLRTNDGDITVVTRTTLNANVDLRGEDLFLRQVDIDFQGELSEHRARGKLNGGGPRLQATSRDGSITLSTRR